MKHVKETGKEGKRKRRRKAKRKREETGGLSEAGEGKPRGRT